LAALAYAPAFWQWDAELPLGTVHGRQIFIVVHHAIGFAGMYCVARVIHRLGKPAAALCALAWAFSGLFVWRATGGQIGSLAFHYLPWIYWCWERAHRDVRYAAGVGALMGLVLFEGGIDAASMIVLVLALAALARLVEHPRMALRIVRTALVSASLTLAIGAARVWPIDLTMRRVPRADSQTLVNVLESLTAREPHALEWSNRWAWPEHSAFVGWSVLELALLGMLVVLFRRRGLSLVAGAIVFGACAGRFHVLLLFYLAPLAGIAIEQALLWLRRSTTTLGTQRALVMLAWVLVAGSAVELVSNDARIVARRDELAEANLTFNPSFDPDCSFSIGRLAIELPAGDHVVRARHRPSDLPWSPIVTLLGLAAALALAFGRSIVVRARSSLADRRQTR
jgi:hypothetical protein